ncbi:hypothetical protein GW930_03070 [Candidatus Saccharibacteria bacterium]|nr:hypothetical protein [Candidatus Saccharibacteria bacterium]
MTNVWIDYTGGLWWLLDVSITAFVVICLVILYLACVSLVSDEIKLIRHPTGRIQIIGSTNRIVVAVAISRAGTIAALAVAPVLVLAWAIGLLLAVIYYAVPLLLDGLKDMVYTIKSSSSK